MAIIYKPDNKIVVFCCVNSASSLSPYASGFHFDVANEIYSERLDAVYLYLADSQINGRIVYPDAVEISIDFTITVDDAAQLKRIIINEDITERDKYLVVKYPAVWSSADDAFPFLVNYMAEALVVDTYPELVFPFHYSEIQTEKERQIWWGSVGFTKEALQSDVNLQNFVKARWKEVKNLL